MKLALPRKRMMRKRKRMMTMMILKNMVKKLNCLWKRSLPKGMYLAKKKYQELGDSQSRSLPNTELVMSQRKRNLNKSMKKEIGGKSVKETKGKSLSKSSKKSAKQTSVYELKEEELEDEPQIKAVKSKVFNKVSKQQGTKEIKPSIKHSSKENKKGSGKLSISVLKSKKEFEDHPTEGLPKNKKRKEACIGWYLSWNHVYIFVIFSVNICFGSCISSYSHLMCKPIMSICKLCVQA